MRNPGPRLLRPSPLRSSGEASVTVGLSASNAERAASDLLVGSYRHAAVLADMMFVRSREIGSFILLRRRNRVCRPAEHSSVVGLAGLSRPWFAPDLRRSEGRQVRLPRSHLGRTIGDDRSVVLSAALDRGCKVTLGHTIEGGRSVVRSDIRSGS